METKIFSIFDTATSAYMRPFFAQSSGAAMRSFIDEANKPDNPISDHPECYALFELGTFDDNKGTIETAIPTCICRAHEELNNLIPFEKQG